MAKVTSSQILATAPAGSSAPDSITLGGGSLWVEYGDGASSTGGGKSTVVQYSLQGRIEHTYTVDGLADGLKYDPYTGDVWVLNNNDGNSNLQLINPVLNTISKPLTYAAPSSSRGYDDVVFKGQNVFLSYTNPVNPGDPVVQELLNGNSPFGKLQTLNILSLGDQGTNLVTGKLQTLPVTDPDSLKLLSDGSLLLTGEADHAYIFIKHPGTAEQTMSFVQLPSVYTPDDAIMPNASSGTFYISNQGANDVLRVQVTGLNTHDLYADVTTASGKGELVQIDPNTGAITPILTGLSDPHGLTFVPTPTPPSSDNDDNDGNGGGTGGSGSTPKVISTQILATAPTGSSAPDSITLGAGSLWVEYGDGASSTGGGTSTIVQYSLQGRAEHVYTADGLADGLKYDPYTGEIWVLNNNDGNSNLQLINPLTGQISQPLTYADASSTRGYDDVVFKGQQVFLSYTNPVNPGDPVVQELLNGNSPFGQLQTSNILSLGDQGTNLATGQLQTLPMTDPDSLKMLPDGSLILTGEADHSFIFISDPGTASQSMSFIQIPAGDTPDDAIMPTATSGTFYLSNQGANDVLRVQATGLNTYDLYADITFANGKGELAQVDPNSGKVTPILTGLSSPHGLAFVPTAIPLHGQSGVLHV
jgi:hypothetical protein